MKERLERFNIQMFAEGGADPGAGATPPPADTGAGIPPAGTEGTPPAGTGTNGGETPPPGTNPSATGTQGTDQTPTEWQLKASDYADVIGAEHYIESLKKTGMTEEVAKGLVEQRKGYLEAEKAKMSPEIIQIEPIMINYINTFADTEEKAILGAAMESAAGRRLVKMLMDGKNEAAKTPGLGAGAGTSAGATGQYTRETFSNEYFEATKEAKEGNSTRLNKLEAWANSQEDKFFIQYLKA